MSNKVKGEQDMRGGNTKFLLQITVGNTKLFFNHNESTKPTYGSMMNHSALHANCVKNLYQDKDGLPVVIFKAKRVIRAQEELLHNYGKKYGDIPDCSENCQLCQQNGNKY